LGKLWSSGTYTALDWQSDQSVVEFPSGGFLSDQNNVGQQFVLTLNQSLWRNFNAAEVKAGLAQARAGADAARAGNRYAAQALLFQARGAYVQLATLREVERIQSESLERNGKILEWTKRKYADNLADKVDVLQVEAALRQVALALDQTREEEAKAVVLFNHLRGAPREEAVDELILPQAPTELPRASLERADLVAAEAALRASEAQVESVRQRFTPDLSLYARLGFNERGTDAAAALADSFEWKHPSTTVGLKLSANLDWGLYREVLKGAKEAQGAGAEQVRGKRAELARDWEQLRESFHGVSRRLALARELVELQREKAEREKIRYRDGRTTNFQVLRFEDDYNLSRIQVLQLGAQAIVLEAQARYYNGEDKPW
jgi:outer membrane protein